jgi:hypothetical protein
MRFGEHRRHSAPTIGAEETAAEEITGLPEPRTRVCNWSGAFAVGRFCVLLRAAAVRINAPHIIAIRRKAMPAVFLQLREPR